MVLCSELLVGFVCHPYPCLLPDLHSVSSCWAGLSCGCSYPLTLGCRSLWVPTIGVRARCWASGCSPLPRLVQQSHGSAAPHAAGLRSTASAGACSSQGWVLCSS